MLKELLARFDNNSVWRQILMVNNGQAHDCYCDHRANTGQYCKKGRQFNGVSET